MSDFPDIVWSVYEETRDVLDLLPDYEPARAVQAAMLWLMDEVTQLREDRDAAVQRALDLGRDIADVERELEYALDQVGDYCTNVTDYLGDVR